MKHLTNILFKKRYYSLLLIAFVLIMASCQNKETSNEVTATSASDGKIQTVGVVNPTSKSFTADILVTGSAMPNQKVTLYAMESGYVKSIRKDIGDRVNKGEVVAQLDNPEIDRALANASAELNVGQADLMTIRAELKSADASAAVKTAFFNRLNGVYKKTPQLTTISEVEQAEGAMKMANALIETKKAQIQAQNSRNSALQNKVDLATARTARLTIRAPFSGIVTRRLSDVGALLQSGLVQDSPKGIVEIQQTNPIRLTLPLPEADATAVKKGMEVTIRFPELPGQDFKAKVSRTAQSLDAVSKTMQVEIDIANPTNKIVTGMYAKVNMALASRTQVLSLPLTAQVLYKDAPCVLIVKNNKVERLALRKGLTGKDDFEVLNAEITKDTKVIVQGKGLVKVGQEVKAILK